MSEMMELTVSPHRASLLRGLDCTTLGGAVPISICTLPVTLPEYYLWPGSNCLSHFSLPPGCGIVRLVEVLSDRVGSL